MSVAYYQVTGSGWAEGECKGKAGWFPYEYIERRERVLASKVSEVFWEFEGNTVVSTLLVMELSYFCRRVVCVFCRKRKRRRKDSPAKQRSMFIKIKSWCGFQRFSESDSDDATRTIVQFLGICYLNIEIWILSLAVNAKSLYLSSYVTTFLLSLWLFVQLLSFFQTYKIVKRNQKQKFLWIQTKPVLNKEHNLWIKNQFKIWSSIII